MKSLRVLSFNIHKGFGPGKVRYTLKKVREAIRELSPDLLCLQEVVGFHARRPHSQAEYLAEDLWPHFSYGKNAAYADGHHGNAILSRFPIRSWENVDVSTSRLERRGLLHAQLEIKIHHKPFHVVCSHLGLFETDRASQAETLCARISALVPRDEPLVVAGDFNDWREQLSPVLLRKARLHDAYRKLHGEHARTFPAWMPVLPLDRVYYRGLLPSVAKRLDAEPWTWLSDHAPLYCEFEVE